MQTEPYVEQNSTWPPSGRHILARFDAESIYVYQAFRPSIASYAVNHQRFGGEFSYQRMSWIKPNFLWMMYRAGWAEKEGQERILAIRLPRVFFDELLRLAVPSSFDATRYKTHEAWQQAVATSDVRLQWDPDHDPASRPVERRAVQLGLRGAALRRFGEREVMSITDVTGFVGEQRMHASGDFGKLITPRERVYVPDPRAAESVGIDLL
jgi:hypothetical protein